MENGPVVLSYAQANHRRRRWATIVFVALTAASCTAYWNRSFFQTQYDRLQYYLAYRRCERLTMPEDQVAYEEDLANANILLQRGDYSQLDTGFSGNVPYRRVIAASYVPPDFKTLFADVLARPSSVYTHGCGSVAPGRLLIILPRVEFARAPQPSHTVEFFADFRAFDSRADDTFDLFGRGFLLSLPDSERLRVYFGQPDPADDLHFTIRYEINGLPGTIDGRLRKPVAPTDHLQVKMQVRDGPARDRVINDGTVLRDW